MIKKWLERFIIEVVLHNLRIGGWCGCCGAWVEHKMVFSYWPYSVCDECAEREETVNNQQPR